MSENEQLQVTSLEEIKKQAQGTVVSMPGWGSDKVNIRLKRPALTGLIRTGKVPNELLGVAEKAIEGGTEAVVRSGGFDQMCELLYIVAENSIVEPSYEDLKELLTDEQLFFIYAYVMQGVRGMENFRKQLESSSAISHDLQNVGRTTKRNGTAK